MDAKINPGAFQLDFLLIDFNRVLDMLNILDKLIQGCAEELGLDEEELNNTLLTSTQTQSQQLSPVVTNVNGFEMSAITVEGDTNIGLKQRRAVARNSQGVIMLKGELSYSSNDQILIDELVFYIQQNDLKA